MAKARASRKDGAEAAASTPLGTASIHTVEALSEGLIETDVSESESRPVLWHLDQKRLGRVIIGIISLGVSTAYVMGAMDMPQGSGAQPGPGMWPFAVGVTWIVISVIVILEALLTEQVKGSAELPRGVYRRDVLVYLASTLVYIILLPVLGQYIGATLYCFALLKFLSSLPWWRITLYSLILGIGISWTFIVLLQVRLPSGMILPMLGLR